MNPGGLTATEQLAAQQREITRIEHVSTAHLLERVLEAPVPAPKPHPAHVRPEHHPGDFAADVAAKAALEDGVWSDTFHAIVTTRLDG